MISIPEQADQPDYRSSPPPLGRPARGRGALRRLKAFERISPVAGTRLLDVGCGNGLYTREMAPHFSEVAAIDVATEHIADFRRQGVPDNVSVHDISATRMPWPDGHFDTATAIEVLEHIDGLSVGLLEIRRVLAPGGRFFVSVPNRLHPIETHSLLVGDKYIPGKRIPFLPWVPPLHDRWSDVRTFTLRTLTAVLVEAGFVVSHAEYVMPPFDHWQAGARFLRPLTDQLEAGPLGRFGVSLLVCAIKPSYPLNGEP